VRGHARNIMTERVRAITPNTPLPEIAATLVSQGFGGVPVIDQSDCVIGFVSEIDLMDALLRDDSHETLARDIMSSPAITIDEFAPADEAMTLLRECGIHHLPVVREGRLVGIIAPVDVLRFYVDHLLPKPPEAG
jgi:CBS domain-containing protein